MTSIENLYGTLLGLENAQTLRTSEEALREMLKEPNILRKLHTIAITRSLDLTARKHAIIQAKNSVGTWKMRLKNPEDDLQVIRNQIVQMLEEPDDVIATNNEILAAKIARLDLPINKWADLLPGLAGLIQSTVEQRFASPSPDEAILLKSRRALSMLNAILKEFGSMKSPSGTQVNLRSTSVLHDFLRDLSNKMASVCQSILGSGGLGSMSAWHDLEISRLSWKCYSRIMLWAWNKAKKPSPEEEQAFVAYFAAATSQVRSLIESRIAIVSVFRTASPPPDPASLKSLHVLTKHIKAYGKAFRRMQQVALSRFVGLPDAGSLVLYYWNKVTEAGNAPPDYIGDDLAIYPEKLIIQGMAIFKDSLSQWSPSRKAASMETDNEVLSAEFVAGAIRQLVDRYIPLNAVDLTKWQEDPEDWANNEEKDNDAWEYEVRPCAERVVITLGLQYPKYTSETLTQLFQAVVSPPSDDLEAILRREAVYCAIGRCAHRLKDEIDFQQWIPLLESEVRQTSPNYRIMKRRIAWVIGRWHYEQCAPASNPKVWEILLHLLTDQSAGTDTVVRFSAATALGQCVNTLDFNKEIFQPYLGEFVRALLQIVNDADTVEIKTRMLNVLNTVIECTQQAVTPYIPIIIQPLPSLWTEAGTDYMLKQSLLATVKSVIEAAKEQSVAIHPLVVPLVQESFAPGPRLQLDADGALLWIAALRECPSLQPSQPGQAGLLDLLPLAISLLGSDLDMLGSLTLIMESYLVLDTPSILQLCAEELLKAYVTSLRTAVPTNVKDIMVSLGLLIQLSGTSMNWANAMHTSGLFAHILKHLLDGKGSAIILNEELHVCARMAIQDPVVFVQLLGEAATSQNTDAGKKLENLLDQWWRQFDSMAEPRHRKLAAMALGNLATTGKPEIIARLSTEISNVWLDVLGEMKEATTEDPDNPSPLNTYWTENGGEPPSELMRESDGTLEEGRRRAIWAQDPAQTVKLTTYLGERVKLIEAAVGSAVFQTEFVAKTDPGVLKQLTEAFAM